MMFGPQIHNKRHHHAPCTLQCLLLDLKGSAWEVPGAPTRPHPPPNRGQTDAPSSDVVILPVIVGHWQTTLPPIHPPPQGFTRPMGLPPAAGPGLARWLAARQVGPAPRVPWYPAPDPLARVSFHRVSCQEGEGSAARPVPPISGSGGRDWCAGAGVHAYAYACVCACVWVCARDTPPPLPSPRPHEPLPPALRGLPYQRPLEGHAKCVNTLAFSPTDRLLASGARPPSPSSGTGTRG